MTRKKRRKIIGTAIIALLAGGAIGLNAGVGSNYEGIAYSFGTDTSTAYTRKDTLAEGNAVNIQIQEEGTTLLKNKKLSDGTKMLPLGSKKVTILGSYSHNYIQGGTGSAGGKDDDATVMLDDAFYDANIDYNESAWEWIDNALGNGSNVHNGTPNGTYMDANDPVSKASSSDFTSYTKILEFTKKTYETFAKPTIGTYSDTAVVTFGRSGAEGASPSLDFDGNKDTTTGRVYLELTDNEKDLLAFCKENFTHTVVLINSAVQMECGFLDNPDYNIDAALWIGHTGEAGMQGVANILSGKANPSGHLADTWGYDTTTNPTFYSADDQTYSNVTTRSKNKYYEYNEGIYVGYRYYETADATGFFDSTQFKSTKFKGNLVSDDKYFSELSETNTYANMKTKGPQATYSGYSEVVDYPFGYGLSYTTFSQTVASQDIKLETHGENSVKVKVTNTGDVAGKDVVQIYMEAPYAVDTSLGISGVGLEKSKVVLVGFGKTDSLKPGESQEVEVKFSTDSLASYDEFGQGCYVLEKGDYTFHVSPNAHGWANEEEFGKDYGTVKVNLSNTVKYKNGEAGPRVTTYNGVTNTEGKAAVNAMNDITAGDGSMLINGGASGNYNLGYLSRNNFGKGMIEIMSYQSDDFTGKNSGNGYLWSATGDEKTPVVNGANGIRKAGDAVAEQIDLKPETVTVDGVNNGKTYNYSSILAEGITFGDGKVSKTLYGYGNDTAINEKTTRDSKSQDDESYLVSEASTPISFNATYYVALDDAGKTVKADDGYVAIFDTQAEANLKGTATKLMCEHMSGVSDQDVERWDKLANELSFTSADTLFGDNAWHQQNADEVGKVFSNSSDGPGEAGNAQKNDNTWWNCACIIAATFNEDLAKAEGVAYGHQDILNGTTYAYAPSMNTHRTPFGGRCFEYYSEDGLLAGIIGGNAASGIVSTGMHVFVKHFALNDSDTNRGGVNTWANESSIREIYSKPYEYSTKFFKVDGIMGSLNSMGMAWSHSGFYQDMTRDEWGWKGMLITDGDGSGSDAYNNYSFWFMGAEGGILGTGLLSKNPTYTTFSESTATNYQKYMLHRISRNALYQYSHNLETLNSTTKRVANYNVPATILVLGNTALSLGIIGAGLWAYLPRKKKNREKSDEDKKTA